MDSGITYNRCFCFYQHPDFALFYRIWVTYQKGVLPYPGTIMDQPAWVLDVLELYDRLKAESEERDHQRREQDRKKLNGK